MRAAEQERKDLVVLVADGHQEQTVATLTERPQSLGIHRYLLASFPILIAIREYSMKLESFLSIFARQYQHALVLIDAEWGSPFKCRGDRSDLKRNGWEGRSAVVVIDPELEIWVWSNRCLVSSNKRFDQTGYWQEGETKPSRPKELLEEVLRSTGNHSAALFRQLAEKVA